MCGNYQQAGFTAFAFGCVLCNEAMISVSYLFTRGILGESVDWGAGWVTTSQAPMDSLEHCAYITHSCLSPVFTTTVYYSTTVTYSTVCNGDERRPHTECTPTQLRLLCLISFFSSRLCQSLFDWHLPHSVNLSPFFAQYRLLAVYDCRLYAGILQAK